MGGGRRKNNDSVVNSYCFVRIRKQRESHQPPVVRLGGGDNVVFAREGRRADGLERGKLCQKKNQDKSYILSRRSTIEYGTRFARAKSVDLNWKTRLFEEGKA